MGGPSRLVFVYAVLAFFLLQISSSFSSTDTPSPSPQESDSPLLSPPLPSPSTSLPPKTGSPPDSPVASPPAPPPSDLTVPGDADVPGSAPSPTEASDMNHSNNVEAGEEESKGMSGGKKAGIAVGVVAAACLVGVGGLVYKRRQANIRRSEYGYAARRELL